jgi:hypothetical protein
MGNPMTEVTERAKREAMELRYDEGVPVRVIERNGIAIWSKVDDAMKDLTAANCEGLLFHVRSVFVPHGAENPLARHRLSTPSALVEEACKAARGAMCDNYSQYFEGGGDPHDGDAQIDCVISAIREALTTQGWNTNMDEAPEGVEVLMWHPELGAAVHAAPAYAAVCTAWMPLPPPPQETSDDT